MYNDSKQVILIRMSYNFYLTKSSDNTLKILKRSYLRVHFFLKGHIKVFLRILLLYKYNRGQRGLLIPYRHLPRCYIKHALNSLFQLLKGQIKVQLLVKLSWTLPDCIIGVYTVHNNNLLRQSLIHVTIGTLIFIFGICQFV